MSLARRFGGAGIRRGIRVSGGNRILLPLSAGTFSRSSSATYMTGAASLATALSNALRFEDRGDGNGPLVLLEGARTNLFDHRRPNNFSNKNAVVINALAGTSLLDGRTQDTVDFGLSAPNHQIFDITGRTTVLNNFYTHALWIKKVSGSNSNTLLLAQTNTQGAGFDISFTFNDTAWHYLSATGDYGAARAIGQLARDNTVETKTLIWDAHQFEQRKFPSSYVDVSGSSASAVADVLTFASGAYPSRLVSGRWKFHWYPYFANDEVDSDVVLLSFGGASDELRYVSSTDKLEVFTSGVSRGASSALTFSRHQKITITLDWPARKMTIAGATTGDGDTTLTSTDEWPDNVTLRIGGRQGSAQEAFGRYSDLLAA